MSLTEREPVHPLLLRGHCYTKYIQKAGAKVCKHFCLNRGRRGCKCMWYGFSIKKPWKRPDECIADAKAGLIDDVDIVRNAR